MAQHVVAGQHSKATTTATTIDNEPNDETERWSMDIGMFDRRYETVSAFWNTLLFPNEFRAISAREGENARGESHLAFELIRIVVEVFE